MLGVDIEKSLGGFTLAVRASTNAAVLGVLGPAGSGKTTLLNCIAGITRPDVGRIVIDGHTAVDTERRHVLAAAKRRIGYVFQSGLLFPHLTVDANLRYGMGAHGTPPAMAEVVDVLELNAMLARRPATLSGGEAQRVAIGRALLSGPRLLLLDEPLTGLDRRLAGRVLAYLKRVFESFDIPAVYVSHSVSDVVFLCDEAWCLADGRLVATGPPARVIGEPGLLDDAGLSELNNVFAAKRDPSAGPGMTRFRFGDQSLVVALESDPTGDEAVLSIPATDIILARVKPERISARNILRGRITRLAPLQNRILAFVDVGVEWMVELTQSAVSELELAEGTDVFAIVKASAVSVLKSSPPN